MAAADNNDETLFGSVDLERKSTSEQVASALRTAILSGQLVPGAHLREATLAEGFKVSRNTVRGAIQALDRDGLVAHKLHRGAFVAEIGPDEIKDIFAVRRLVELSAFQSLPSKDDLVPLETAQARLREAIHGGEDAQIWDSDLEFHAALAGLTGSVRLTTLFGEMEAETRLSLLLLGDPHPDPGALFDQHRRILDYLDAGDLAEAQASLREDLRLSEKFVLEAAEHRDARPHLSGA